MCRRCCISVASLSQTLETEPKDAGPVRSSGVVRLNTIRQIIEQVTYTLKHGQVHYTLKHRQVTCTLKHRQVHYTLKQTAEACNVFILRNCPSVL